MTGRGLFQEVALHLLSKALIDRGHFDLRSISQDSSLPSTDLMRISCLSRGVGRDETVVIARRPTHPTATLPRPPTARAPLRMTAGFSNVRCARPQATRSPREDESPPSCTPSMKSSD